MTRKALAVAAAGALASAAAAAVIVVVKHRQGQPQTVQDRADIESFAEHLTVPEGDDPETQLLIRFWNRLKDRGVAVPGALRERLGDFLAGMLDDDQEVHLESQIDEIGGQASQQGM
jgi:hypothetical protein